MLTKTEVETVVETCKRQQGSFIWSLLIALFMVPLSIVMMMGQPEGTPLWFATIPLFILIVCLWLVYATFTRWRATVHHYSSYIDRMLGRRQP